MVWMLTGLVFLLPGPAPVLSTAPPDTGSRAAVPTPTVPSPPRHTVRIGGGYQPGAGLRLLASYRYAGWPPAGTWDTAIGWSEALFGHVEYTHAWMPGIWPARRWTLSAMAFSRYAPNRQLEGTTTDERRTGGRLRLTRTTTGDWHHRQSLQLAHARLHLRRAHAPNAFRDLSSVVLGTQLRRTGGLRLPVPALLLGAKVRGGWDHAAARGFVTAQFQGRSHRTLGSSGWAVVADGHAQWASANTPAFEQAALGGTTSVRGYRTDTAIGRALATLQQELWAPLPGTASATTGVRGWLHRHIRLAAFFDAGGVAHPLTADTDRVRTGLGAGVRLILGPATIRADWGHRTPDVLSGTFRGALFLSVRPNLSLGVVDSWSRLGGRRATRPRSLRSVPRPAHQASCRAPHPAHRAGC